MIQIVNFLGSDGASRIASFDFDFPSVWGERHPRSTAQLRSEGLCSRRISMASHFSRIACGGWLPRQYPPVYEFGTARRFAKGRSFSGLGRVGVLGWGDGYGCVQPDPRLRGAPLGGGSWQLRGSGTRPHPFASVAGYLCFASADDMIRRS